MILYRVDVFLLAFLSVLVNSCEYNDCICVDQMVACESTDDQYPLFSSEEILEVTELELTSTQTEWITQHCADFPRLNHVIILDKHKCPDELCVPCM